MSPMFWIFLSMEEFEGPTAATIQALLISTRHTNGLGHVLMNVNILTAFPSTKFPLILFYERFYEHLTTEAVIFCGCSHRPPAGHLAVKQLPSYDEIFIKK